MKLANWFNQLNRTGKLVLLVGAVGLLGLALAASAGVFSRDLAVGTIPTFVVQRGPLTINVLETGTIKPRQQEIIKSEVEGNTTIIYLIPEGTVVKKDDLLIQLDVSKLDENLLNQQITVRNAEASFIRAREQFAMTQTQTEIDITRAKLDYQFAQEDLANYVDGEYPKLLMEAENKITLAREQMEQAREKLRWSERLFEEKYLSQTEFESDRLALQRAKLDHELSVANKDLLQRFTRERKMNSLTTNVDQMKRALDKAMSKANADLVQAEADLRARQAEFDRQKQRLAKIEEQIAKTRLVAPRAGMVVYATSAQGGGWRGNTEPLAEGQQVRERQDLIYLPTAAEFDVELKIHESSLEKIRIGQPVRITIDALPGEGFSGRVSRIAPLPDPTSVWLNPDLKVYTTTVQIDGDHPNLRTGMNCRAEIVIEQYDDALFVPVQAVLRVNGQPTVWSVQGNRQTPRVVQTGLDNNRMIRILEGVTAGERISLAPPLSAAGTSDGIASVTVPANGPATASSGQSATSSAAAKGTNAAATATPPIVANTDVNPKAIPDGHGSTNPATPAAVGVPVNPEAPPRAAGDRGANLSEEERAQRRRQFENMTPEQRDAFRQQMRQQREAQNAGSGGTTPPVAPRGEGQ